MCIIILYNLIIILALARVVSVAHGLINNIIYKKYIIIIKYNKQVL